MMEIFGVVMLQGIVFFLLYALARKSERYWLAVLFYVYGMIFGCSVFLWSLYQIPEAWACLNAAP